MQKRELQRIRKLPIRLYTSNDVAEMLGLCRGRLAHIFVENPHLRSKLRLGRDPIRAEMRFTDEEVIRIIKHRLPGIDDATLEVFRKKLAQGRIRSSEEG